MKVLLISHFGKALTSNYFWNVFLDTISEYPYKVKKSGNYLYTDSINYKLTRFDISNNFLIENKYLYGNDLAIDFRFLKRMGIEVDYLQLFEKLKT